MLYYEKPRDLVAKHLNNGFPIFLKLCKKICYTQDSEEERKEHRKVAYAREDNDRSQQRYSIELQKL